MHYIAEQWQDILVFNELDSQQKMWDLEAEWFEEPNNRRGGWSGVSRIELKLPTGGIVGAFLKRQENHVSRSIRNPIKGRSTFASEFDNILKFQESNIPTLDVICFADWKAEGHKRSLILTQELDGYFPLSSDEFMPKGKFVTSLVQRKKLFKQVAILMQRMHEKNFQHNGVYLKHLFAMPLNNNDFDLRIIDLEGVKRTPFKYQAVFRDLYTLHRHAKNWSIKDQVMFYKFYSNEKKLSADSKKLLFKIAERTKAKNKK